GFRQQSDEGPVHPDGHVRLESGEKAHSQEEHCSCPCTRSRRGESGARGIFDITKLGATSDGKTDCSRELQEAWNSACGATEQAMVLVPKGEFLVGPLNFSGPYKGSVTIQIDGTLLGSNDLPKYDRGSWMNILQVDNLVTTGSGTIDGQGTIVYTKDPEAQAFPNSLLPDFMKNGTVSCITLLNSKFFHMNIYMSEDVKAENLTITAPGDNPNTDGIHIGDSSNINVTGATISTGDDCISIGGGSSHIKVTRVTCGPGQGIIVGCLGRYRDEKDVSDVTVKDCVLWSSTDGVRIKTYEDAVKSITASNLTFKNIKMEDVANPIIIDQNYCPEKVSTATKSKSEVTVKDVIFRNITGTSSTPEAVSLLCSEKQRVAASTSSTSMWSATGRTTRPLGCAAMPRAPPRTPSRHWPAS
uniref:Exopolygalacturonase n=1 Tax=Aegilops tauschii subsp. strangulata TaxID=200361 RepID=A0A453EV08_AEGTS